MEKSDFEIVQTVAIIPREQPQKRVESVEWQLKEILDSTLPKKPFDIPKEEHKRFLLGSVEQDGKIDSRCLFGLFEIDRMTGSDPNGDKQVMISITLYADSKEKGSKLVSKFRDEFTSLHDLSSLRQVSFNSPFDGGEKYIPQYKEVDLNLQNPQLSKAVNHHKDPIYQQFTLSRVYKLSNTTEGESLDSESVFLFGLNEALPRG